MTNSLRREARKIALQSLFEVDAVPHDIGVVLQRHLSEADLPLEVKEFIINLVHGVQNNLKALDQVIVGAAPNWPLDQMAKIDKNILRLAIFEILIDNKSPMKAVINEAIELSKIFGSESSSRFVNGVLGTVVTQKEKGLLSISKT